MADGGRGREGQHVRASRAVGHVWSEQDARQRMAAQAALLTAACAPDALSTADVACGTQHSAHRHIPSLFKKHNSVAKCQRAVVQEANSALSSWHRSRGVLTQVLIQNTESWTMPDTIPTLQPHVRTRRALAAYTRAPRLSSPAKPSFTAPARPSSAVSCCSAAMPLRPTSATRLGTCAQADGGVSERPCARQNNLQRVPWRPHDRHRHRRSAWWAQERHTAWTVAGLAVRAPVSSPGTAEGAGLCGKTQM